MAIEVGGALLSSFFQVLFDRMASQEVVNFFKGRELNDHLLKKLKTILITVNGVLDDAERKQIARPAVQMWLDELKHAVYDADDLLDEITYEALRSDREGGSHTITNQVRMFFSSRFPLRKAVDEKLEEILKRLEYLIAQKDVFGLQEGIEKRSYSQNAPTSCLIDESGVYGRDGDRESIIKLLLSDDANGENLGVIPIWGMPGIGKTTLAQLVYNDNRLPERFDLKAWVCVSYNFDLCNVTKDILEEFTRKTCDTNTLNRLQLELKHRVMNKKFILVLDDVWNDNYEDWDNLLKPLRFGSKGSKVIVTARNEDAVSVMATAPTHHLKELTSDDCWSLFIKHAFDNGNSDAHPDLQVIGEEIVRKCKGLPLAVKALGGLLHSKKDPEEWKKVVKSNMWDLPNDNVLPALSLSYHDLPSQLKQCFAYCAIIPKNYKFTRQGLVDLWMAEGFLNQSQGSKEREEIGDEYFNALVSRSFIQRSTGDQPCFVMHGLISDLAKFVSRKFCFRLEGDTVSKIPEKTRHLFVARTKHDAVIYNAQHLRTFFPEEHPQRKGIECFDKNVYQRLLLSLKSLRVLSLRWYHNVDELPDSIGNLKHLRHLYLTGASIQSLPENVSTLYFLQVLVLCSCKNLSHLPESIGNLKDLRRLNLHGTSIKSLPDSVTSLHNLQTLILSSCKYLVALPTNMGKLVNLSWLAIAETKLQEMPLQIGKLTKLFKLTDFIVGDTCRSCSSIKGLAELQNLRGKLRIRNLQNVVDAHEALEANLKAKKYLTKLELRWEGDAENSLHERGVLQQVQPHTNLECLSIVGYGGTRFPDWVGDNSFSSMVSLKLSGCKYCSSLPPLGQLPTLKDLALTSFDEIVVIGSEFYGSCTTPFGSLITLRFEKMLQWCEWISHTGEGGAFLQLQELYIKGCPNLEKVHLRQFVSLTRLQIEGGRQLVSSLPNAPTINRMDIKGELRYLQLKKSSSGLYSLEVEKWLHHPDSPLEQQTAVVSNNLENIRVKSCDSLKCLPLERFRALCSLSISQCHNLVSFQNGRLPAPNLKRLVLGYCSKLKSLPDLMHSMLPSLEHLCMEDCPEVQSFPEGGLPPKLLALEIYGCKKFIDCRRNWNLQALHSLSLFGIGKYGEVESFPERLLLPPNITYLHIWDLQNLKALDYEELQHLRRLEKLKISHCYLLHSLPEEGLPSSLCSLSIQRCPVLQQRCRRGTGEDWQKISHIPRIYFNHKRIREQEEYSSSHSFL